MISFLYQYWFCTSIKFFYIVFLKVVHTHYVGCQLILAKWLHPSSNCYYVGSFSRFLFCTSFHPFHDIFKLNFVCLWIFTLYFVLDLALSSFHLSIPLLLSYFQHYIQLLHFSLPCNMHWCPYLFSQWSNLLLLAFGDLADTRPGCL